MQGKLNALLTSRGKINLFSISRRLARNGTFRASGPCCAQNAGLGTSTHN